MNISRKIALIAFAIFASWFSVAYAAPAPQIREHGVAISVCSRFNDYQPAEAVRVVPDGRGNSLVWIDDADGDLWLCNADNHGNIYANNMMAGDMLRGHGLDRLLTLPAALAGDAATNEPQAVAERICRLAAPEQPARAFSTTPDGMDDYTVFVRDAAGADYLCNASGNAEIFTFVRIGVPLNQGPSI
jgi:hypothetical protein